MSILPTTFYRQIFCTKVLCAAFMCLHFGFVCFWQKEIGAKAARKNAGEIDYKRRGPLLRKTSFRSKKRDICFLFCSFLSINQLCLSGKSNESISFVRRELSKKEEDDMALKN